MKKLTSLVTALPLALALTGCASNPNHFSRADQRKVDLVMYRTGIEARSRYQDLRNDLTLTRNRINPQDSEKVKEFNGYIGDVNKLIKETNKDIEKYEGKLLNN